MGEMSEYYEGMREESKSKKESNKQSSTKLLDGLGIKYDLKNNGVHLIVKKNEKIFADFWPSTGKYRLRDGKSDYRRGVFNLIKDYKKINI